MVTLDIYAHDFADRKREVIDLLDLPTVAWPEDHPAYSRPKALIGSAGAAADAHKCLQGQTLGSQRALSSVGRAADS